MKSLIAFFTLSLLTLTAYAQNLHPTSLNFEGISYQVLYEAGLSEQATNTTCSLQSTNGGQGFIQLNFKGNFTEGRANVGNKAYSVVITTKNTTISPIFEGQECGVLYPPSDPPISRKKLLGIKPSSMSGGNVVIDVMVLYTTASLKALGSESNMVAKVKAAMAEGNDALTTSKINVTINLIYTGEWKYTEGANLYADLPTLANSTEVANLRNQYGADLVCLLSQSPDQSYGGLAYLLRHQRHGLFCC
jgi:hypothetical protein